jgi:hypothetical protein
MPITWQITYRVLCNKTNHQPERALVEKRYFRPAIAVLSIVVYVLVVRVMRAAARSKEEARTEVEKRGFAEERLRSESEAARERERTWKREAPRKGVAQHPRAPAALFVHVVEK